MSDAYVPLHHTAGGSSTPASPAVMDSGVRVNIKRRVVADSPAHVSSVRTGGGNGGGSGRRVPDSLLLGWLLVTGALLAAVLWLALVGRDKNDSDQNDWTPPVLTSEAVYQAARADLLSRNAALSVASQYPDLTPTEQRISDWMGEQRSAFQNSTGFFPTAHYFFGVRPLLESSTLFPMFQSMPKGAVLHIHTSSLGDTEFIIGNLTHRPNCYVLMITNSTTGATQYTLSYFLPGNQPDGFATCSDARAADPGFDGKVRGALEMSEATSPRNRTTDVLFPGFQLVFGRLAILKEPTAYYDYYYDGLVKLIQNGVQYVEIRTGISSLTAVNGTSYPPEFTLQVWSQLRQDLRNRYASIGFDLNLIASYDRARASSVVSQNLISAFKYKQQFPDLIIGFDLVNFEDPGHTTEYFSNVWIQHQALTQSTGVSLPFYFHDGESDQPNDTNVYDAILCSTRRIGHGFNLWHFPYLEQVAKQQQIAVEVCPLSNQILGYVADLRLHPAAGYFARGVPMVLSSDDPGIFGYVGMGYDYLAAYLAWGLSLKDVKSLVWNSLKYTALRDVNPTQLQSALGVLQTKWDAWITSMSNALAAQRAGKAAAASVPVVAHNK